MGKEEYNQKLLVEGKDDLHVVASLCAKYSIPENFDIIYSEGKTNLLDAFRVRLKQSGVNTIGIIIDADTDINNQWLQIKGLLEKSYYTVPDAPDTKGTIIEQKDLKKIGIWIMPDNKEKGMLEDFIKFLIPENDKLIPHADNTLASIEKENLNKYKTIHRTKALVHTWLAWQENPGTPLGQAITKRYLNTDEETCQRLIDWLSNLFKE
jgi:hypothetical protein